MGFTDAGGGEVSAIYSPPTAITKFAPPPGTIAFNGTPDAITIADATISNGSANLTSASNPFNAGHVGKSILVTGAAASGKGLVTTIQTFVSSGQVTLATTASTAVSGVGAAFGTDNGPSAQTAINALTAGTALIWPSGSYMIATGLTLFNGTTLTGYGATLIGALPSGQFDTNGVIFNLPANLGTLMTLNANVAFGAKQILLNGTVAKGNTIFIVTPGSQGQDAIYTVEGVSGSSPQTVSLDRCTLQSFSSATAQVYIAPRYENIRIQGFTMMGRVSRAIEVTMVRGGQFSDLTFNGLLGEPDQGIWTGFDGACLRCDMRNLSVLDSSSALGFEGNEDTNLDGFYFRGKPGAVSGMSGLNFNQCYVSKARNGTVSLSFNGVEFDGNYDCTIDNVTSTDNVNFGFNMNANTGGAVRDSTGTGNGSSGLIVQQASTNTIIDGGYYQYNGDTGIIDTGKDTEIRGVDVSFNTADVTSGAYGITLQGTGLTMVRRPIVQAGATANHSAILVTDAQGLTPNVLIEDPDITQQAAGQAISVSGTTAMRLHVRGGKLTLQNAGCWGILVQAGVAIVDDLEITSSVALVGTAGIQIYSAATELRYRNLRTDANTDSPNGGPTLISSGASNHGTVLANGTTGVDTLFPVSGGDRVTYTLRTVSGTPGRPPVASYTRGVKFTTTSVAGDTSTYDYVVG
jgi:hypothetical protein